MTHTRCPGNPLASTSGRAAQNTPHGRRCRPGTSGPAHMALSSRRYTKPSDCLSVSSKTKLTYQKIFIDNNSRTSYTDRQCMTGRGAQQRLCPGEDQHRAGQYSTLRQQNHQTSGSPVPREVFPGDRGISGLCPAAVSGSPSGTRHQASASGQHPGRIIVRDREQRFPETKHQTAAAEGTADKPRRRSSRKTDRQVPVQARDRQQQNTAHRQTGQR